MDGYASKSLKTNCGFDWSALICGPMVRDFYGALVADRKAVKGVFLTTSTFTSQAREFAESVGIELIDGAGLKRLFGTKAATQTLL